MEELPSEAKVYVTIDIDVLDMSLVPGCVSAEPNGMMYEELKRTLKVIAEHTDRDRLRSVRGEPAIGCRDGGNFLPGGPHGDGVPRGYLATSRGG